jgi:hypothetical protein
MSAASDDDDAVVVMAASGGGGEDARSAYAHFNRTRVLPFLEASSLTLRKTMEAARCRPSSSSSSSSPSSFWRVDTEGKWSVCGFNSARPWHPSVLDMYRAAQEYQEHTCNFEIHHEPSGETFHLPTSVVLSKSNTIKAQITSDFGCARHRTTISAEETSDVNVVRCLVMYLFTGFLLDPSLIEDINTMTASEARHVRLSFSVLDLYKTARFLQMETLLAEIREHLVFTYRAHTTAGETVVAHLAGLLWVAQVLAQFLYEL